MSSDNQMGGRPARPAPPPSLSTTTRHGMDTVPGMERTQRSSRELHRHIKTIHDEAFLYIEQALYCDERGQGEQAVVLYKKGLVLVNQALDTRIPAGLNGSGVEDDDLESAKRILQKMKQSQQQIHARIEVLGANDDVARALQDPPPSYEQATSPNGSMSDIDLTELGDELFQDNELPTPEGATKLFSIEEGVQIFYINPAGSVTAPSYPSDLKIFRFYDNDGDSDLPPAFLQVGEWRYPLLPGGSPALYTDSGAYIFPDVLADRPGSTVGVILPPNVTNEERHLFLHLLSALTTMLGEDGEEVRVSTPEQDASGCWNSAASRSLRNEIGANRRTSEKISAGLVSAAEWISWGLEKGAEKTGELLKKGSTKLKEQIQPEGEPSKIDPRVQEGMKYVRKASHTAVEVTSFVVTKLGEATVALGRKAAPHLKKQGVKLLPESWTKTDTVDGKSRLDDALVVASGGLQSFATIFMSLEVAARALARSIASETVRIVNHKYGKDAGGLTDQVLYSAGNIAMATRNANCLGIKAIAKRAAKDTGHALVEDGATGSNQGQLRRGSGQSVTPPSKNSPVDSPTRARLQSPLESPTSGALQSPESPTRPCLANVARDSRPNPTSSPGHRKPPS
ncbi:spartin-like [Lineus longissimus]|uniref:spartin-like n=1 Tax=Lineus longissimus TaxID=88925 RepID=UPI002B4D2479